MIVDPTPQLTALISVWLCCLRRWHQSSLQDVSHFQSCLGIIPYIRERRQLSQINVGFGDSTGMALEAELPHHSNSVIC
jgi:hypothetical protein